METPASSEPGSVCEKWFPTTSQGDREATAQWLQQLLTGLSR